MNRTFFGILFLAAILIMGCGKPSTQLAPQARQQLPGQAGPGSNNWGAGSGYGPGAGAYGGNGGGGYAMGGNGGGAGYQDCGFDYYSYPGCGGGNSPSNGYNGGYNTGYNNGNSYYDDQYYDGGYDDYYYSYGLRR